MSYEDECALRSFYGYQVHYPAFFEQVPDSLIHETGCCQFYFGNMLKIAQTAFIVTNLEGFTVRQGMEHFAMEQHATERRCGNDYFILSGPLYINHRPVEGYRFYAKYVQRQNSGLCSLCLTLRVAHVLFHDLLS